MATVNVVTASQLDNMRSKVRLVRAMAWHREPLGRVIKQNMGTDSYSRCSLQVLDPPVTSKGKYLEQLHEQSKRRAQQWPNTLEVRAARSATHACIYSYPVDLVRVRASVWWFAGMRLNLAESAQPAVWR
jgi:hypothetical protein